LRGKKRKQALAKKTLNVECPFNQMKKKGRRETARGKRTFGRRGRTVFLRLKSKGTTFGQKEGKRCNEDRGEKKRDLSEEKKTRNFSSFTVKKGKL